MGSVFFVMAIMGCGDGQAQCVPARIESVRYASMQQCRAALPQALMRNADLSFPVIAADCRASGTQMVRNRRGAITTG